MPNGRNATPSCCARAVLTIMTTQPVPQNHAMPITTLLAQAQQHLMQSPAQAAAEFAAALTQPEDTPDAPTPRQRVQLGLCLGLTRFHLNRIPDSLAASRPALQLAATLPWPTSAPRPPANFDAQAALPLLEQTLAALCAAGLRAFATDGTLLGLTRTGRLIEGDKDLDIAVPIGEFERARALLPTLGWQPAWIVLNAINFRAFVHRDTGLTLDLVGYGFDAAHQKVTAGWWPPDRPAAEGRLVEVSDFTLIQRPSAHGPIWTVRDPERLLAEKYGPGWRQPDPGYESILGTPGLVRFNDFTRAFGYLRLLEAWLQGRQTRVGRQLDALTQRDPHDPLLTAWQTWRLTRPLRELTGGTIGVYDLLHVGHLRFLEAARADCARLQVGIATAASAWRSKAATPVIADSERLELVRGLGCVDEACLFDGTLVDNGTAADWIAAWGVQAMFVSEDWAGSPRWQALEPVLAARGIRCVWLPYTRGISSTAIRERMRAADLACAPTPP